MYTHWKTVLAFTAMTAALILTATPASAVIQPGTPADGVVDLVLDVTSGALAISTDGITINGYVIDSDNLVFTGGSANNLGWFVEDEDWRISGNMGFTLTGQHDLGDVVGPEWLSEPDYWFWHEDLAMIHTIAGSPGAHVGTLIIIPEPATVSLLVLGCIAIVRRKRSWVLF